MKISIKTKQCWKEARKRPNRLFQDQKKAKFCLWHCYSFVIWNIQITRISLEIFFEIWIKSCWPCIGAHFWCFSDFSCFLRLHTLGTMVPQFAYWSIDSFLHPYQSHLPFTPVLTTRMIRALPRCPCRIYIADTQTGLQALNLLGTYNTRNEFFVSSLETCLLSKHFQWLGKKYISNLAYLKSY